MVLTEILKQTKINIRSYFLFAYLVFFFFTFKDINPRCQLFVFEFIQMN